MRLYIFATIFAILSSSATAELQCDRQLLSKMATEIISNRQNLKKFGPSQFGGDAAYLMLRSGRMNEIQLFDAMGDGQVDLEWARQHHDLWVADKGDGDREASLHKGVGVLCRVAALGLALVLLPLAAERVLLARVLARVVLARPAAAAAARRKLAAGVDGVELGPVRGAVVDAGAVVADLREPAHAFVREVEAADVRARDAEARVRRLDGRLDGELAVGHEGRGRGLFKCASSERQTLRRCIALSRYSLPLGTPLSLAGKARTPT